MYPGIAQLAERAIDNREAVGSNPTPWTILGGRRQAVRHQVSTLALRGFNSHRPLHLDQQGVHILGISSGKTQRKASHDNLGPFSVYGGRRFKPVE